jgi:hypothetical protein
MCLVKSDESPFDQEYLLHRDTIAKVVHSVKGVDLETNPSLIHLTYLVYDSANITSLQTGEEIASLY